MSMKECNTCRQTFMPKYEWQKICWTCFLKTREGVRWQEQQKEQANGFSHSESFYKRQENRERNYAGQGAQHGFHDREGFHYEEQEQEQEQRQRRDYHGRFDSSDTLSKDLLRKLIMLCHPDKHGGSEMSNEVTKTLLGMKEKMK